MKYMDYAQLIQLKWSHPSRGAWIEIEIGYRHNVFIAVAPLTGCVD